MNEKCPLGRGLYWDRGGRQIIPSVCQEQCADIWGKTMQASAGHVDRLVGDNSADSTSDLECIGTALWRTESYVFGTERTVSTLHECFENNAEVTSETWQFNCPYN